MSFELNGNMIVSIRWDDWLKSLTIPGQPVPLDHDRDLVFNRGKPPTYTIGNTTYIGLGIITREDLQEERYLLKPVNLV